MLLQADARFLACQTDTSPLSMRMEGVQMPTQANYAGEWRALAQVLPYPRILPRLKSVPEAVFRWEQLASHLLDHDHDHHHHRDAQVPDWESDQQRQILPGNSCLGTQRLPECLQA